MQKSKDTKKWQKFEHVTHKVIQELNPKNPVYKNVFIEGRLSRVKRQIDVKMEEINQYDFVAFECKDYKRVLDVAIIEKFNTKLQDIGAKRGAIVSNSPFSKAAQNMAGELNIILLNLIDTSNENVNGKLFAGLLISDIMVKGFRVRLQISVPTRGSFSQEVKQVILQDASGKRGTAYEIFTSLWNSSNSPLSKVPGTYEYLLNKAQNIKIISREGEVVPLDSLSFVYEVVEKHYLGKVELIEAQGLYNVKDKSFQTRSVTTQVMEPYKFETRENEIPPEKMEELKGEYTFGLSCVSLFSEDKAS